MLKLVITLEKVFKFQTSSLQIENKKICANFVHKLFELRKTDSLLEIFEIYERTLKSFHNQQVGSECLKKADLASPKQVFKLLKSLLSKLQVVSVSTSTFDDDNLSKASINSYRSI